LTSIILGPLVWHATTTNNSIIENNTPDFAVAARVLLEK
jgi:hypothetical protein